MKVKVGVFGLFRGKSMAQYFAAANNAEVVAICEKREEDLQRHREENPDSTIAYYTDFDEFIKHGMDAVVLANYGNEHAPFAIKALKAGKHVYSEVMPVQTMKEAVELVETVESTGKIYAYGENYCYLPAPYEMRRLYRQGKIGEFEYGECEYVHNLEPIIHMTGLRPVSVTGFEGTKNERALRCGKKGGSFGMEIVTLENDGIVKSLHGDLYRNSVWYAVYGAKGRMESAREDALEGGVGRIYINADPYSGAYREVKVESYLPDVNAPEQNNADSSIVSGHWGSDFRAIYHFIEKIRGSKDADIIDVYEAMDMALPGIFAYRSILQGNIPVKIPDLREKVVRDQFRNDTACTDPNVAGEMLLPTSSMGTPEIADGVYAYMKQKWQVWCRKRKS